MIFFNYNFPISSANGVLRVLRRTTTMPPSPPPCSVVAMDCETSGLAAGSEVYVVSLCDTSTDVRTSYVQASPDNDAHLVAALDAMCAAGTVVTFNGAGFDFRLMAARLRRPADRRRAARLAIMHVDVMLSFGCAHTFTTKLQSMATHTLGASKTLSGGAVSDVWASGDRARVVAYCEEDASLTGRLYEHGLRNGWIDWRPRLTRQDGTAKVPVPPVRRWGLDFEHGVTSGPVFPKAFACVARAAAADYSWMDDPESARVRLAGALEWAKKLLVKRARACP